MLRIVPQAIPADNEEAYRRAIEEVRLAWGRAVAAHESAGGSFGDQEAALLAARPMHPRHMWICTGEEPLLFLPGPCPALQ